MSLSSAKKKMERGISHATANESLVSAARTVVQHDFHSHRELLAEDSLHTPLYTFTLPDLTRYTEDFRGFLEKDLIEVSALISLEQSGRLNWWADTGTCQRLWPLATTGDGNCLLHAASLGMWGFHDRLLTLRKTLYTFLTTSPAVDSIYRRWRWHCAQQNSQSGLALTEDEWSEEWSSVLRLASPDPRTSSTHTKRRSRLSTVSEEDLDSPMYESLEEVHVLVLAHVLRRPIIVVSDTVLKVIFSILETVRNCYYTICLQDAYGEALAPISFGGIYLPLEVPQSDCDKSPLILTYDAGHFSALVTMQSVSSLPTVIPLTDSEHSVLTVQFALDPGHQIDWGRDENNPNILNTLELTESEKLVLLREYLDMVQVPLPACFLDPAVQSSSSDLVMSPDSVDCEVSSQTSQTDISLHSKSKTAKQLQSVVKQFGSIGKTVSKKIRKNFGSITRLARSGSFKGSRSRPVSQTTRLESCRIVAGHQDHILAAMIHTQKCLPYLQEMISNYLQEARVRFEKDKELKALQTAERLRRGSCVSPEAGCRCESCSPHQDSSSAVYGSGRSKFYVNNDDRSYETLKSLPHCRPPTLRTGDKSLYLAHSTFYRDTSPALVVPVPPHSPDPMPIVPVDFPPPKAPVRNLRKKGVSNFQSEIKTVNNNLDAPDCRPVEGQTYTFTPTSHLREAKLCQTRGCPFFGSFENNSYCSKCFRDTQRVLQASKV